MAEMALVQCKAAEPVQSRNTTVQLRRRKQSDDLSDHCSRGQVRVKHVRVCEAVASQIKGVHVQLSICVNVIRRTSG